MMIYDAILAGCKTTKPLHGQYMTWDRRACALGAAMVGADITEFYDLNVNQALLKHFPELGFSAICPVGNCRLVEGTMSGCSYVIHLNDDHEWSRERIAFHLRDKLENEEINRTHRQFITELLDDFSKVKELINV